MTHSYKYMDGRVPVQLLQYTDAQADDGYL